MDSIPDSSRRAKGRAEVAELGPRPPEAHTTTAVPLAETISMPLLAPMTS